MQHIVWVTKFSLKALRFMLIDRNVPVGMGWLWGLGVLGIFFFTNQLCWYFIRSLQHGLRHWTVGKGRTNLTLPFSFQSPPKKISSKFKIQIHFHFHLHSANRKKSVLLWILKIKIIKILRLDEKILHTGDHLTSWRMGIVGPKPIKPTVTARATAMPTATATDPLTL